ncbi:MAG: acetyl-CoA carboxylase biotin carboxyl carrier protein [Micavibrio aeruginosavorus]|uniref:Biotin carboxyl carrier protein of acetyl-CoA carboxylase n=1 Tax=Micavibrio aeruginosavorus TaxID=349221 RepID=A0A2W5FHI4_9BACT|nr:MAG: acetyl-CoA carboxylase biotin carboxyl carrier protein [Micavibrio aeruginosavorus]
MKIDADAIRQLSKLLEETGLTEIEVADGEKMIRVNKGGPIGHAVHHASPVSQIMPSDPTIPQAANTSTPAVIAENHPGAVKSPMVGTAYLQSDPNSPPFISKGATVKPGDTLLIIEAMKVMNPIKAAKGGVVKDIIVENASPVEFGEVLVIIE